MVDTVAPGDEQQKSAQALLGEAEPWEPWETQLVGWSIGIGLAGLVVLGFLINTFILP
jgi:hypothetical protein